MMLPFSRDEFFSVFERYNESVWPAQLLLTALAVIALVLALRRSKEGSRGVFAILGILWFWMALVYHAGFLTAINPAAVVFTGAFLAQSFIFVGLAARRGAVTFTPRRDLAGFAGGGLIAAALLLYPVLSVLGGHAYPAQPTFGLPCPTTVFTLGMLLWLNGRTSVLVFVIPALWTIVGTVAAVELRMPEDYLLAVSLAIVIGVWMTRKPRIKNQELSYEVPVVS